MSCREALSFQRRTDPRPKPSEPKPKKDVEIYALNAVKSIMSIKESWITSYTVLGTKHD
jgi:hypothetical protein